MSPPSGEFEGDTLEGWSEVLDRPTRDCWPIVGAALPPSVVLMGGTALAVHLRHRRSRDPDVFVYEPFEPEKVLRELRKAAQVAVVAVADGQWTWDTADPLNGAEIVWSDNDVGTKDWFSPFMSGARRRPNGNTISALGYNKRIREVTPEGHAVLDFLPGGPGRTFRVVPVAADHPGLARLGVTNRRAGPRWLRSRCLVRLLLGIGTEAGSES